MLAFLVFMVCLCWFWQFMNWQRDKIIAEICEEVRAELSRILTKREEVTEEFHDDDAKDFRW